MFLVEHARVPYADPAKQREAQRRYAAKRRSSDPDRVAEVRKSAEQRNRDWLEGIKTSTPCADCGVVAEEAFEAHFDHVSGVKHRNVMSMLRSSRQKIQEELDKCVVRCVSCHNRVTHLRIREARAQRARVGGRRQASARRAASHTGVWSFGLCAPSGPRWRIHSPRLH